MEFRKQNYSLRIEWICSRGLGTNSGHGEVWIRVLVQCYTECNNRVHQAYALHMGYESSYQNLNNLRCVWGFGDSTEIVMKNTRNIEHFHHFTKHQIFF